MTDSVVWQEGMLLRPQHFQQHDRYLQHQIQFRSTELQRNQWGFNALELNSQYLRMGKIALSRGEGVFPDGTLFDVRNGVELPVIDIPAGTTNTLVYLALPISSETKLETRSPEQQDVVSRSVSYESAVLDTNSQERQSYSIVCSRLDFKLQLGDSDDAGWVRLPVCKILEASAEGDVRLSTDFYPTYLKASASQLITDSLRELIGLLDYRSQQIAGRIRSSGAVSGSEVGDFLMLQVINRALPRLNHWINADPVHPETVYLECISLLGELSTYSGERRISKECNYQHGNQGDSFNHVINELRNLLSQVLEQHVIELPVQERKYGIHVTPLEDKSLLSNATLIMAASADAGADQLRSQLPSRLKVGAVERIRDLVNLNMPGITITPLPIAPRQLPFHADHAYFALEMKDGEIAELEQSGGMAMHASGDLAGLGMKLWAIRKESE